MARTKRPMPPTTWRESELFPPPNPRPKHINHLGISGGKDSTALLLWALHESGYPRESLDVSFCDTGNESQYTYDYIDYLEQTLQVGITRIKPGLDFWELAKRKRRFPSAKARFCTFELKIKPTLDYINAMFRAGHTMTLHSGVRASESDARSKLLDRELDGNFLCEVYRPLLKMNISDVWAMHERYGVKPNPLYLMGASRVGCRPCCMSRKKEIAIIAKVEPEIIDKIEQAENESGSWRNNGYSSFFEATTIPKRFHSRSYRRAKDERSFTVATIRDVVAWAQTEKGAKIDPRTMGELALEYDRLPVEEDAGRCSSSIGFCE